MWGLSCVAAHRAVQAGLVTGERAVTPAELRGPAAPFRPFLPAGMQAVDEPNGLVARYGAVLADGVPMAVCSLAGPGLAERGPSLRAGAAMAGLDLVGEVGGPATAMHAHLPAVQRVLGALGSGSLFATADFGVGHAEERVHRRAVGGRPEFAVMDRALVFDAGRNMLGVARAAAETAGAGAGALPAAGAARVDGDVILRQDDPLEPKARLAVRAAAPGQAATAVSAAGGFAFGGTQAAFSIPAELGVGTSMRARGAVAARGLALSGDLGAGGNVAASGAVAGRTVAARRAAGAPAARISGTLRVGAGGCSGCRPPRLGP